MTSKAPERIWTQPDMKGFCITGVWPHQPSEQRNMTEYTRADALAAAQARVAELEAEAERQRATIHLLKARSGSLRALVAELKAERDTAWNDAIWAAAEKANSLIHVDDEPQYQNGLLDAAEAIRTLLRKGDPQ